MELRTEQEIMASWVGNKAQPKLSIICNAYNHEKFIDSAIQGFLIQETNFPFEIYIHDDASTDKTADIIRGYEANYPHLIRAVYETENKFSKNENIHAIAYKYTKGDYIAICEGDDYWTDPLKLQKQADYLDANPNCVVTGHNVFNIDENNTVIRKDLFPKGYKEIFTSFEVQSAKVWMPNLTRVFRRVISHFPPEFEKCRGDTFLGSLLGEHGYYHYHHDIKPAAYRIHGGGIWSSLDQEGQLETQLITRYWMYKYYKRVGKIDVAQCFMRRIKYLSEQLIKSN